jgi:hypothetical protein
MKKIFTLLLPVSFLFCLELNAQEVVWMDGMETENAWTESHAGSPNSNRWAWSSCNAINGSRSMTVNGPQTLQCYFSETETGTSLIYRKIDARCYVNTFVRFYWKCGTDRDKARGSVVYSTDGMNWTRITSGGPGGDGYYYGRTSVQLQYVALGGIAALSGKEFYIGFVYETLGLVSNLHLPFTIDDVWFIGTSRKPFVSAGAEVVSACPGESVTLNGSASAGINEVYKENPTDYFMSALNLPGSSIESPLDFGELGMFVNASDIHQVKVTAYGRMADIQLILIAPDGSSIYLSKNIGPLTGGGYENTTFSASAPVSVTEASYPYQGPYRPQEPFSDLKGTARGIWKLRLVNSGVLSCQLLGWSATFLNTLQLSWSPVPNISGANTSRPVVSVAEDTEYTFTVSNAFGCSASATTLVRVSNIPSVSVPSLVEGYRNSSTSIQVLTDMETLTRYQYSFSWEVKENHPHSDWKVLVDDEVYSGSNGEVLHLRALKMNMNGNLYRVNVQRCDMFPVYSGAVELRVLSQSSSRLSSEGIAGRTEYIALFPNPAKDLIYVKLPSGCQENEIVIYNSLGEVVAAKTSIADGEEGLMLDLSGYIPGIYSVKAGNNISRFVKQ